jgi:hypothetical protein
MIDQAKKNRLISRIKELESSGADEILLAPADYFDGYEESHCTICPSRIRLTCLMHTRIVIP